MTKYSFRLLYAALAVILSSFFFAYAQQPQPTPTLLKRTTYKTEKADFGAGGTLTLVGAPAGNITVEGWQQNQVEISADIEVQAENEADLAELARVDGFVIDNDFGHLRVITIGTHDKDYLKRTAKKFPKRLLNLPFKIDYRLKVPMYCDLEINGGRGDFNLSNVQGLMQINFLEAPNAKLDLTGGDVAATFGKGSVQVNIPTRSWRGRGLDVQLAVGDLSVFLQPNFNADLTASILRNGKIENSITSLKPRQGSLKFTEKSIVARNGAGGIVFDFKVGDGTLKMSTEEAH